MLIQEEAESQPMKQTDNKRKKEIIDKRKRKGKKKGREMKNEMKKKSKLIILEVVGGG